MKKFFALVVVLCAVMISSSVSATETFDEQTPPNASHYDWYTKIMNKAEEDQAMPHPFYNTLEGRDDWYVNFMSNAKATVNNYPTLDTRDKAPIDDSPFLEMSDLINVFVIALLLISAVALLSILFSKNATYIRLKNNLLADLKNFWILIFCVVTLATCIFYVPYNYLNSYDRNKINEKAYGNIFKLPKGFYRPELTQIDYQAIVFREILILLGCCAGYTASTIIKKK